MRNDDSRRQRPWRLLRAMVRAWLPAEDRVAMCDELDALYERRVSCRGRRDANWWYVRQTVAFVVRLTTARLSATFAELDSLPSDIRIALRSLRHRGAYVAAFIATLGVGVGVVSTVYAAAHWVLLRAVPGVRRGDEIVTLRLVMRHSPAQASWWVSEPDFQMLRDRLTMLRDLAATKPVDVDVRLADGVPTRVAGEMVSTNYFSVLQTRFAAGRPFVADDGVTRSAQNVIVLSDALARHFARDVSALVGSSVKVNGAGFRVIGVAEPGFRGATIPGQTMAWVPLAALPVVDPSDADAATSPSYPLWERLIGRMQPGATAAATGAAANGIVVATRGEAQRHSLSAAETFVVEAMAGAGLDPSVRASVRHTLSLIALAAALLFALAIANIANLSLVAATRRETSTAIRAALGATNGRLTRELLVETALLGLAGGIVAIVLAALWSKWFAFAQLSSYGAPLAGMHVDLPVLAFGMTLAIVAACVASLRPALIVRSGRVEQLIRRGATAVTSKHRLRIVLVALQMALSVILLVAGGLLESTVKNLRSIDLGFDPNRLLTFALDPEIHGLDATRISHLADDIEHRLVAEPGIAAAGLISPAPLRSSYMTGGLFASADRHAKFVIGAGFYVTPGFLRALGVHVLAGIPAWRGDSATIVITRAALDSVLPGVTPDRAIGRILPTLSNGKGRARIVQVIDDIQLADIKGPATPTIFHPLAERFPGITVTGFVRMSDAHVAAATVVRRVIADRAPDIPVFDMHQARDVVDEQFAERTVMSVAASTLSALGLLLAAIGLYGVLASAVAARQREIGIRSALGASPSTILRSVFAGGLLPTLGGAAGGLVSATVVARLLRAQLFGLDPFDIATYSGSVIVLLSVAALACVVPAWRATRVSPAEVLRSE